MGAGGVESGWGSERRVMQWEEGEAVGHVMILFHLLNCPTLTHLPTDPFPQATIRALFNSVSSSMQ